MIYKSKLSSEFQAEVEAVAKRLKVNVDFLLAAMAFETGETFSPSVKNKLSGATGLIQFMPATAKGLGTTTAALAAMSAVEQLKYVEMYFKARTGKLKTLSDVYMAILWPRAVGKPEDYVLFQEGDGTQRYFQNKGIDRNKDGLITKAEAAALVQIRYDRGMKL